MMVIKMLVVFCGPFNNKKDCCSVQACLRWGPGPRYPLMDPTFRLKIGLRIDC